MSVQKVAAILAVVVAGCTGSQNAVESSLPPTSAALAREGSRLLALGKADSATVVLVQALAVDSSNSGARADLALARYQRASRGDSTEQLKLMREAYEAYADLENRGSTEMAVYDRLCELAQLTEDTAGFLHYAHRAAEHYPYDRQMLNLGRAQLGAGLYGEVVQTQKEAIKRFPDSPYRSGFYRLLGQAYVRVDRYQTAQRVFAEGVEEAEKAIAVFSSSDQDPATLSRIEHDRIAMLVSLRRLYTIYDEHEKLRDVERRLKETDGLQ